jgi:hypothetical protein
LSYFLSRFRRKVNCVPYASRAVPGPGNNESFLQFLAIAWKPVLLAIYSPCSLQEVECYRFIIQQSSF